MRLRRRLLTSATAALAVATALLAPPSAHAAGVRVYALGDSITWGTTWRVVKPKAVPAGEPSYLVPMPGGYRQPLDALLTQAGLPHEFVGASTENSTPLLDATGQNRHNGHRGYRIDQVATGLDGRPAGQSHTDVGGYWLTGTAARGPITPDVTIIHLGTNDIGQLYDPGTTYPTATGKANLANPVHRATFVANLADRLQALVDKIQALRPGSRIVLSTLLPVTVAPLDVAARDVNVHVARIAREEGERLERVVLADPYARFTTTDPNGAPVVVPGLISEDDAHPTPAGYALLATVYRDGVLAAVALP